MEDNRLIRSSEIISLHVDSLGILSIPKSTEPIAEREERVSLLRVSQNTLTNIDYTRCMFRIESDLGQNAVIHFGSVVTLIHVPTELIVVGNREADNGLSDEIDMKCVFLRNEIADDDEMAHKWVVLPRYKLRTEGDPVRVNDYIILRNAQYKNLALSSFQSKIDTISEPWVGLLDVNSCYQRSGMKILKIQSRKEKLKQEIIQRVPDGKNIDTIKGNDFIRLAHCQYSGHMIARVDDEKEIQSMVAPLGSVCRKQTVDRNDTHAVFVRPFAMQQPKIQYDFSTSFSCLGLWQIVIWNDPSSESYLQGNLLNRSQVYFKHVVSGQYLSIRPMRSSDTKILKENYYQINTNDLKKKKKNNNIDKNNNNNADEDDENDESDDDSSQESGFAENDLKNLSYDRMNLPQSLQVKLTSTMTAVTKQPLFKVTMFTITANNLKSTAMVGKNNPYILISFGEIYQGKTQPLDRAGNSGYWILENDKEFSFTTSESQMKSGLFKVIAMSKHSLLQDSMIGQGYASLKDLLSQDKFTRLETAIDLVDKRGIHSGRVLIGMLIEKLEDGYVQSPPKGPRVSIPGLAPSIYSTSSANNGISPGEGGRNTPNQDVEEIKWVVATTTNIDEQCLFTISALHKDENINPFITYEDILIVENVQSKLRLKLSDSKLTEAQEKWWEYKQDVCLKPTTTGPGEIIDSDVFRFERVALAEVQDAMYASRFLPLARASTTTLQLTPSSDKLYLPIFRHFKNSLSTLLLWTLDKTNNDGALLEENMSSMLNQEPLNISLDLEESKDEMEGTSDKFKRSKSREDSDLDDDDDDFNAKPKLNKQNSLYLSPNKSISDINLTSPRSADEPDESKHSLLLNNENINPTNIKFISSIAPWLGRNVEGEAKVSQAISNLDHYIENFMQEFLENDPPANAKILRRQSILADLKLIEQLMHFLNVFFMLQRALTYTHDKILLSEYPTMPPLVQLCCNNIQLLLHAIVHNNEKNALKMISVRGSFMSLISQKILGWNPPIEKVMKIACGITNEKQQQTSVQLQSSLKSQSEVDDLEEVLMKSITPSDLRHILEQMNEMHLNGHPGSENILSLLALLCRSGKAKTYFQSILIRLLVTCDEENLDFGSSGGFAMGSSLSRSHQSMLFETDYLNNQWYVRFKNPYILPPQESRNIDAFNSQLQEEGSSLRQLFSVYNAMELEDDILDLEESFCLLEDLGFGGPFLYEEIGFIIGSNVWGFLKWWCYRASFYYPSTSISHSQISPFQAMKLMGLPILANELQIEINRSRIDRENIVESLRFQTIISSRIPGFELLFIDVVLARSSFSHRLDRRRKQDARPNNALSPRDVTTNFNMFARAASMLLETSSFTFQDALAMNNHENLWFRNSLLLFAAICEGRNTLAQRMTSILLPVECIIYTLETNISAQDKSIFCDLLVSVYLNHDYVFATRCVPFNKIDPFCGCYEDIYNPEISLGKVFNPLTRIKFSGSGFEEGSYLRQKLFVFITNEILNISLYSSKRDIMSFNSSLLYLLEQLIVVGFFGDKNFLFFDFSDEYANDGMFTKYILSRYQSRMKTTHKFSIRNLEAIFVNKLNECLDIHRNNMTDEEQESLNNNNNNEENNHNTKSSSNSRKNFNDIDNIIENYEKIFSNTQYSSIIKHVISILHEFYTIQQMVRTQYIWNEVNDISFRYSYQAYTNDLKDLHILIQQQTMNSQKFISTLFDEYSSCQGNNIDEQFTAAIFSGTLHHDVSLRKKCYDLLDKRLSEANSIVTLIDQVHFMPNPHESFVHRLLTTYFNQLMKYSLEIIMTENQHRPHLLQLLDFASQNLLILLFDSYELRQLNPMHRPSTTSRRGGSTEEVLFRDENIGINTIPTNRFEEDRNKVVGYYVTSGEIPCPAGEDDFFLLDLKKTKLDEQMRNSLLQQYSIESHQLSLPEDKPWIILAKDTVKKYANKLLALLFAKNMVSKSKKSNNPNNTHVKKWNKLSLSMRALYNRIFILLAKIGAGNKEICNEWFQDLIPYLVAYYPYFPGAIQLTHLLLRSCSVKVLYDSSLASVLLDKLVHINGIQNIQEIKYELLIAVLKSEQPLLNIFGSEMILGHLEDYFTVHFKALQQLQDDEELIHQQEWLLELCYPIMLCVEKGHNITPTFLDGVRLFLPTHFCQRLLLIPTLAMKFKAVLVRIILVLYDAEIFPLEELLLVELRSLRIYFEISRNFLANGSNLLNSTLSNTLNNTTNNTVNDSTQGFVETIPNSTSTSTNNNTQANPLSDLKPKQHIYEHIQAYIFDCILPMVKTRILETHTLNISIVNTFILSEISRQESKLINKNVGRTIMSLLKNHSSFTVSDLAHDTSLQTTSYLPSEVIACVMVTLNLIAANNAMIFRHMKPEQYDSLIFVVAAMYLFVHTRADLIFDRTKDSVIDKNDFIRVIERSSEILEALILIKISQTTETFLFSYYKDECLDEFRSRLYDFFDPRAASSAVVSSSMDETTSQKLDQSNNLQENEEEQPPLYPGNYEEKLIFKRTMDISPMYTNTYLKATSYYKFLKRILSQVTRFIDINGLLLIEDSKSPIIKSKSYINSFRSYTDFDIWLLNSGKFLTNMFEYLGNVTKSSKTEYNLIHLLCNLTTNSIEEIRNSSLISLNIKIKLIEIETNRLHHIQHILSRLGMLPCIIKVLGRFYQKQQIKLQEDKTSNNTSSSSSSSSSATSATTSTSGSVKKSVLSKLSRSNQTNKLTKEYEDYLWSYVPLMIKLANEMLSYQNTEIQNEFTRCILYNINLQKPPEYNCFLGLQAMIRHYALDIVSSPSFDEILRRQIKSATTNNNNNNKEKEYLNKELIFEHQINILRASIQIFTLIGSLCNGDNRMSQALVSANIYYLTSSPMGQELSNDITLDSSQGIFLDNKILVNIAEEMNLLLHAILVRFTEMIMYIDNDIFYDKLAPPIYAAKDNKKRRFLAWHHPNNNIYLFSQYLYTISIGLENCISICGPDCLSSILKALPKTPQLLEFLGLMQLTTKSKSLSQSLGLSGKGPISSAFNTISIIGDMIPTFNRTITWKGGDPFKFYTTYIKEMRSLNLLHIDKEYMDIAKTLYHWKKTKHNYHSQIQTTFQQFQHGQLTLLPKTSASATSTSHPWSAKRDYYSVFGISQTFYIELIRKTEYNCLRLLLSTLEITNHEQGHDIVSRFHDSILIQNMNTLFLKLTQQYIFSSSLKDLLASSTVSYISLIESIGSYYTQTDELLSQWDQDIHTEYNLHPKTIYGSVEIVGADRRLRRLYFPVPSYVHTYWGYPEVQKTKNAIVMEVNRDSPEEKIGDFLSQLARLSIVIKRQERLRMLLTYPIHALFGGKSFDFMIYLPSQRYITLLLTLGLNIYFVYIHTKPNHMVGRLNYLDWFDWDIREMIVYIVQWVHCLLCASFAFRALINSEAADKITNVLNTDTTVGYILNSILIIPATSFLLAIDSAWPLIMTGFSFFALRNSTNTSSLTQLYWLYVPCLVDMMFQFDAMYFLYLAISRNVFRVGFTLILAFLCLYFYAILAYLFLGNQYNLNGYVDCEDPGACFKLHLDYGLNNAPAWDGSGFIRPHLSTDFPYSYLVNYIIGTIYNLTYVILINLVLQAIISGLIIDTFSSMREENENKLADIADKCFICSITRDEFEQAGISFNTHIQEEHNMWNYMWFKIYLELKDPMSFSSTENYAYRAMQERQSFIKMMPIKQSLTLQKIPGDSQSTLEGGSAEEGTTNDGNTSSTTTSTALTTLGIQKNLDRLASIVSSLEKTTLNLTKNMEDIQSKQTNVTSPP